MNAERKEIVMLTTYENVVERLNESIPRDVIKERDGGGNRKLSYLEGHYVINRLNKVLGVGNWATQIIETKCVYSGMVLDSYGKEKQSASYTARVRLVVEFPNGKRTEFEDVGFGNGFDKADPGKPHELATKEAITDAIKRCAKNLGSSMGLALYDKEQTKITDTPVVEAKVTPITTKTVVTPVANKDTLVKLATNLGKVAISKKVSTKEDLVTSIKTLGGEVLNDLSTENLNTFINTLKEKTGYAG